MTLADICDGMGRYILPDMWGEPNRTFTTGYQWPNQGWPTKQDWILWQLTLQQAFPVDHLLRLQPPLGDWLSTPHQSTHQWHWLTSYATQELYQRDGQWKIHIWHTGYSNCNPKYCAHASRMVDILPGDCKQVTLKKYPQHIWCPCWAADTQQHKIPNHKHGWTF